jgi:hypothetical protein
MYYNMLGVTVAVLDTFHPQIKAAVERRDYNV